MIFTLFLSFDHFQLALKVHSCDFARDVPIFNIYFERRTVSKHKTSHKYVKRVAKERDSGRNSG